MASVKPSSNNSDSLGTSSVRWGDIYAQDGSFSGTLSVSNLTVTGTTTSIESVSYQVTDPIIVLAQANSDASEALIGIQAERGSSDAWLLWNESLDAWVSYIGADTDNLSLSNLVGNDVQGETFNIGGSYQLASEGVSGIKLENVTEFDSATTSTVQTTAQAVTSMNNLTALGDSSTALAIGSTEVEVNSIKVGDSVPFADASGVLTLQNVDALDSATEATIENAIDTLGNLTSIGSSSNVLTIENSRVDMSSMKIGSSIPFVDNAGSLTLQNVDILDDTTESTIENALDTLPNVTAVGTSGANLSISSDLVSMNSLQIGSSTPFADASGTLTLQNVDALDATTENTIESAIDSLPNLTAFGTSSVETVFNGSTLSLANGNIKIGSSVPFSDSTGTLTLQNVDALDSTTQATITAEVENNATTFSEVTAIGKSGANLSISSDLVSMNSLRIGSSNPFSDASGTLTLQNVDALDSTSQATITSAVESNATSFIGLTTIGSSLENLAIENAVVSFGSDAIKVGSSVPFSDASGTLTLQNVDALDATTESTIESALDTLPNVTSVGTSGANLSVGSDLVLVSSLQIGDSNPFSDASGTLTLQNVDALDSTSRQTIEGALTDLSAITQIGSSVSALTFNGTQFVVGDQGLKVGDSTPFSDSSGTLTLQNVDALDATTESTIENAIDTLANLTSFGSSSVATSFAGSTLDLPAQGLKVGDSVPFSDATGTLTLQNVDALDATSQATITAEVESNATTFSEVTGIGKSGANLSISSDLVSMNSLQIGSSNPFSDDAGALTLQNVDDIDTATRGTIESAIQQLPNVTTILDGSDISSVLTINGGRVDVPSLKIGASIPFADASGALTLQNVDALDSTTQATITAEVESNATTFSKVTAVGESGANLSISSDLVSMNSLQIGSSNPFSDASGVLTLQNVDALDATSRQTIEGALTDLTNLTAFGKSGSTLTFNGTSINVGSTGLQIGSSVPFSDASGALTLQNVDALDSTTEATIEGAIDTLANLTSFGSSSVATSFIGSTLDLPAQGLKVGDSIPFSDASGTLTLQNVDSIDATTETTIANELNSLPNLRQIGTTDHYWDLDVYGQTIDLDSAGNIVLTSGSDKDHVELLGATVELGRDLNSTVQFNAKTVSIPNDSINLGSDTLVVHATNGSVGFGTDSPSANSVAQFNGDIYVSNGSAIKNAIDSNDFIRFDTDLSIRSNGGKLLLIPEDNEGLIVRDETGFDALTVVAKDSDRRLTMLSRSSAPSFISGAGVGSAGDSQGSIVHYDGDLFFCVADYDSGSPSAVIWKKISLASI